MPLDGCPGCPGMPSRQTAIFLEQSASQPCYSGRPASRTMALQSTQAFGCLGLPISYLLCVNLLNHVKQIRGCSVWHSVALHDFRVVLLRVIVVHNDAPIVL